MAQEHGFPAGTLERAVDLCKSRSRTLVELGAMVSHLIHDPGAQCGCMFKRIELEKKIPR
jgi:hypothetical protein